MLVHAENFRHLEMMKDPHRKGGLRKYKNWASIGNQGYVSLVSIWN